MRVEVVAQGGASGFSLAAAIKPHMLTSVYDRLDVAVAYATLQGVRALERVLVPWPVQTRWVLGLDDAITQPEAIAYLRTKPGADVRVAKLSPIRRFHPKLYRLWSSASPVRSLLALGSGNMTQRGLQENAEAAVILIAETVADYQLAARAFGELWAMGHGPTAEELANYSEAHAAAAAGRRLNANRGSAPREPEPSAVVGEVIPAKLTGEYILATCVARIAATKPDGVCTFAEARAQIPKMVALTPYDREPSPSQPGRQRWDQRVNNINSNKRSGRNFVLAGRLVPIKDVGYRITEIGRDWLKTQGFL
jgi:hypothetical protein